MALSGRKDNRGGPREIPDRRRIREYDSKFKNQLERSLMKEAKALGYKHYLDGLAKLALDPDIQDAVRASAWKIISEVYVAKQTHKTVDKTEGPHIMLPALNPRPMPEDREELRIH